MSNSDFNYDADIILEFLAESLEHLEGIDSMLMEFEQNPDDKELINSIFRAIHSIKGASGFLGFNEINKLSHRLETLLDKLRKGTQEVTPEVMDVLFKGCDLLKELIENINDTLDKGIILEATKDEDKFNEIFDELDSVLSDNVEDKSVKQESKQQVDSKVITENHQQPQNDQTSDIGYKITPKLLQDFQVEANEHLEICETNLIKLSDNPDDDNAINEVFRSMHSIKGTSSYLQLNTISKLAHSAESLLELIRQGENTVTDEELDLLFEALDLLKELIANPNKQDIAIIQSLVEKIEKQKQLIEKGEGGTRKEKPVSVDPLSIFLDAAEQHISTLKQCVKKAKEGDASKSQVDMMFRAAHSLKSSGRYMGFQPIEYSASMMEESLELVRAGKIEVSQVIYDIINDALAEIEKFINSLGQNNGNEPVGIKETAKHQETEKKEKVLPVSAKSEKSPSSTSKAPTKITPPKTMRVNQELLDTFMNLVGELIVARNAFGHIERKLEMGEKARFDAQKELRSASLAVSRISEEMQRTVMEMRMVPIRNVFQKFPRMVRDLTRKSGKEAQIILQGEDTEIDKGIAEDLSDPLVHIIRNSVDHGLETPEERRKAGKPESGTIILKAAHEGNFIFIDIIDDGKGIDTDAVLAKAIEKGLVSEEQAQHLTHDEICNFVFKPGFSTAKKVTDISGRGVGMDVVMTNLKKLKGNVQVTSEKGQGTKVRLEVPLTLALVDALLVEAGSQTFAMPLEAVAETVKVPLTELKTLMKKKAITLRGEVISVASLSELLNIGDCLHTEQEEITLLILKIGVNRLGIIVDKIQRKEEIVVKPLADYLAAIPGLGGASILGDGRSILILEPNELMGMASKDKQLEVI